MQNVPVRHSSSEEHRRLIAQLANQLIPVIKSVTLTNSSTTTTVTDEKMGIDRTVQFTPTTTDAASENIWLSSKLDGSFVLTHASATTTRTYDYIIR